MTRLTLVLGTLLLLLGHVLPARAQELPQAILEPPAASQGYYFSLGLHGGVLTVEDKGDTLKSLGGYAAALHIGQEVLRWMDLGIAIELGSVVSDERTGSLASLGIEWTLRPVGEAFVRLGCGFGVNQLSAPKNSDNDASAFGGIAAVTLGYAWFPFRELRDSGGFSLSPVLRLMTVQPFAEDAAYWAMAGFEVSFWTGLPQRQLELPLDEAFPAKGAPTR